MLLVASNGHKGIEAAASGELPGTRRKRCTSNATTLVYQEARAMGEVPEHLSLNALRDSARIRRPGPLRGVRLTLWRALPGVVSIF